MPAGVGVTFVIWVLAYLFLSLLLAALIGKVIDLRDKRG